MYNGFGRKRREDGRMPENIRTAVIGIGHMGSAHARCTAEGKVPGMVLSAVCDLAQDRLEHLGEL